MTNKFKIDYFLPAIFKDRIYIYIRIENFQKQN